MDAAEERVKDLPEIWVREPSVVRVDDPLSRAVELLLARPESRVVHVVDADRKLVGTVSWRSVLGVAKARMGVRSEGGFALLRLLRDLSPERMGDIMRTPAAVREDALVADVLLQMERSRENDLPIVDAQGRLVGEVNAMHVMALALRVFRQTEADLAKIRKEPPGTR